MGFDRSPWEAPFSEELEQLRAAHVHRARRVLRPIHAMIQAMRALAAGDATAAIPAQTRRDEIGAIAAAAGDDWERYCARMAGRV